MSHADNQRELVQEDEKLLNSMGYAQELARRMGGFSNFAISMSIICILAGGITSFHQGLCSVGGASIGLGWPLVCLFSLVVAITMGQIASAFPTAGSLYHWAAILGGPGWGWATAWFNLAGLVTVLAAINVGTYLFVMHTIGPLLGIDLAMMRPAAAFGLQTAAVSAITLSQAMCNDLGIRATTRLTDFSGYWIVLVSLLLTAAMLVYAPALDFSRLVTFTNYSGAPGGNVWPETSSLAWLFALGFLLPAYTVTGFDASAHVSEETIGAALRVPRCMVRAVLVSGIAGWVMLSAIVLAPVDLNVAAGQGENSFYWIIDHGLPRPLAVGLFIGIAVAQYLCGLATVTSASRMAFGFARDGGLPLSARFRRVHPTLRTPSLAIWTVSIAAVLFTLYTPAYTTIAAVCAVLLYISYVLPITLGLLAYGRRWTKMGPWDIGRWYRPLALLCLASCGLLIAIGVAPPNDSNLWFIGGMVALLAIGWFGYARGRFVGPPTAVLLRHASEAPNGPLDIEIHESMQSSAAKATSQDGRDDTYVSHH